VVIEKQPWIGGVCIATGTIPSKTFREAVCSRRWAVRGEGTDHTGKR
jgi:pyruvate/2-oxoglutarate dehydrogenase complex dihydrolipoamide dehydrogenase (E3) component